MNADAIKNKLQTYYQSVTPEQVLAEFEALGVEFNDAVELSSFHSEIIGSAPAVFNDGFHSWQDTFLVKSTEGVQFEDTIPVQVAGEALTDSENPILENYQYAMAA